LVGGCLIHGKSHFLTVLTSLTSDLPVAFDMREESNNQWDFLYFVHYTLESGHLMNGDYLVIDNASVHGEEESIDIFIDVLEANGVKLIYLPKYSPELNPCELVFNFIKRKIHYVYTNNVDECDPCYF